MLTNHAAAIRSSSANACAYCHQPVYCARCHKDQVLPGGPPGGSTTPSRGPAGLRWPIIAVAGP
jgi:hypothetical protein